MKSMNHTLSLILRFILASALVIPLLAAGSGAALAAPQGGFVYTLSNDPAGNAVVAYQRASDGSLSPLGSFATGGLGTGAGLGSQGSIILSDNHRWLFAVNAGSNEISAFAVQPVGLSLVSKVASGGVMPVSLAARGRWLYALNAGGSGNIAGFRIENDGTLSPLAGSSRPLSSSSAGAAQISFDPQGETLVVTEKATNVIDTYEVKKNGLAEGPQAHASVGQTPYGFDFGKHGTLVVSEAFGGAAGAGAVSSYHISEHDFATVSGSAADNQTAPCWVVVTNNGRFAYTSNAGSGSISGYRIGRDGSLSLLDAEGRTGLTGGDASHPTDMALSQGSGFLYALLNGTNQIAAFRVNADGSLVALPFGEAPAGAVGLAAW